MISASWLTEALRDGGYLPNFQVRDFRVTQSYDSDSATLYTLRIRYSDVSVARRLPDEMVLKVSVAGHPRADKEVTFYGRVLPALRDAYGNTDLSLADGYHSYYDVASDRSHVLMAGIPSSFKQHLEPLPPTKRHFTQLADALGRIHAHWWEDERLGDTIGVATTETRLDAKLDSQRAAYEQFLSDGMIVVDRHQRDALNAVAGKMPADFRERLLTGKHVTLIHSDLKPANLLYSHNSCRILDWKDWRLGIAAEDLAWLMAFHWPAATRKFEEPRFLKRCYSELKRFGSPDYTHDDLIRDYRIAVGLRLGELIGCWRREDWRKGNWRLWKPITTGLRAFQDLRVSELFSG